MEKQISSLVINRLPRYFRYLGDLLSNGVERISSKELSEKMNVTASQIRQDLNFFGSFGQQGYGYNVEHLYNEIAVILGIKNQYKAILIGAGNMGQALIQNTTFEKRGFKLIGIFDNDPDKIGKEIMGMKILDANDIKSFIEENQPTMAIISTPRTVVNQVVKNLKDCGIHAFLNFSYAEIAYDDNVVVENIHLSDSLMRLCYKISARNEDQENKI
ncbi:MAG: redox-sensing transcriptional repressor Rex [Clostridia bacterium]|nr:redox-sensing transcriptional repressor Rex [Clostridia bacterium]